MQTIFSHTNSSVYYTGQETTRFQLICNQKNSGPGYDGYSTTDCQCQPAALCLGGGQVWSTDSQILHQPHSHLSEHHYAGEADDD